TYNITTNLLGGTGLVPDPDAYFYTADCTRNGVAYSATDSESGTIPGGTRFVVTTFWIGTPASVRIKTESDGVVLGALPKLPAPVVKGTKTTNVLPGTGVAGYAQPGLYALAAAFGLALWLGGGNVIRRGRRRAT
ncbi:MAG: hypothetical protein ACRDKS_15090, partial [Actinomycetota bacterium]